MTGDTRKRAAVLGKVLAAAAVALPGAYGALKGSEAAGEREVRLERAVRDEQERALQAHLRGLREEIAALRRESVTHDELLEVVVKLAARAQSAESRTTSAASPEVDALRRRAAAKKPRSGPTSLPTLRPAAAVRQEIEQRAAF